MLLPIPQFLGEEDLRRPLVVGFYILGIEQAENHSL